MRFWVYIRTAGGPWTLCWTDNWWDAWFQATTNVERKSQIVDREYGLAYHVQENTWTKVGFSP